jgi:hypothetical protein
VLNARPTSPIDHPPKRVKIPISPVCSGAPKPRSTSPCSKQNQNSSDLCLIDSARNVVITSHRPRSDCAASGSCHKVEVNITRACETGQATRSAVRGKRKSPLTFRSVGSSQPNRDSTPACSSCALHFIERIRAPSPTCPTAICAYAPVNKCSCSPRLRGGSQRHCRYRLSQQKSRYSPGLDWSPQWRSLSPR